MPRDTLKPEPPKLRLLHDPWREVRGPYRRKAPPLEPPAGYEAEVERIADAMHALVTVAVEHDLKPPRHASDGFTCWAPMSLKAQAATLAVEPVGASCRLGLRQLFRRVDAIGGHGLVEAVIAVVAYRGRPHTDRTLACLRSSAHGVGEFLA